MRFMLLQPVRCRNVNNRLRRFDDCDLSGDRRADVWARQVMKRSESSWKMGSF